MNPSFAQRIEDLLERKSVFHIFLILVFSVYAGVRIINLTQAVQRVKSTADTPSYVRISREDPLSSDFLANSRPFVFPLLLKLFNADEKRVAWAQGIFSIFSWSLMALSLAYSLRTSLLRFAAFGLLLLLSLYQYIVGWDSVLLTESLSLSLMALFLAAWLWLSTSWHVYKVAAVLAMAVIWGLCRDTNAWVLLLLAALILLLVLFGIVRKSFLVFPITFAIIFLFSNLSADHGQRWVFPFQNVLGRRILPDAAAVDFFGACGMPVTTNLMRLANENANGLDRAFYLDPALEEYRTWLHESGKSCYVKWLLSDPVRSIRQPLGEFNALLGIQELPAFLFSRRFQPILPRRIEALLYPRQLPLLIFIVALAISAAAIGSRLWVKNRAVWVAVLMILLVLPHYFLVWHGDILGIERHMVPASIQLYLGTWILLLLSVDSILPANPSQKA